MLFKREMNRNFKSFLIIVLICSLMAMYMISIMPSMGSDIQKILDLKLPKQFQVAFGMQGLDFNNPVGVFSIIFSYMYLFLSIYFAGIYANIVSKEFSDKTAEYLFSLPASRTSIIFSKLIIVFIYTIATVLIIFLVSWLALEIFIKTNYELFPVVLMALAWIIGGITFGAIGFLLSSFFTKGRTITALTVGVVVGMFVLQVIISMNHTLDFLKYICPFEWFKGSEIAQTQSLSLTYILIAISISALSIFWGIVRFKRMDVLI